MTDKRTVSSWSLDSNILLYCYDDSPVAALKKQRSQKLLALSTACGNVLAGQVCGEVFRVLHSKLRLPSSQVLDFMSHLIKQHKVVASDAAVLVQAMQSSTQTNRQFWDCLIIATCAAQGVKRLYTEDTGAEPHTVLGVELVNPFLREDWDDGLAFS
jgi:predicted nucleic acid-binding protein